jgi:hypothetical protein
MRKSLLLLSSALLFLTLSCSKTVVPNFTTVDEIYNLKPGMSLSQVNQTLGVLPHEFYTNFQDGSKVVEYKYRRKYQRVSIKQAPYVLNSGSERFRDEESVFVVFDAQSGKMRNFVTTAGRKSALKELNNSYNLSLIQENPIRFRKSLN